MGYGYEGDCRRVRRGERLMDDIVKSGCVVMRRLSGGRAAEVAAHRFLGSPEVTLDGLLTGLTDRTRQACRGRYVVAAQDTTEINFSGADRGRRGLGLAGDGKSIQSLRLSPSPPTLKAPCCPRQRHCPRDPDCATATPASMMVPPAASQGVIGSPSMR